MGAARLMNTAVIRPLQRPVPLRQSVYDALIDLIVGGELPPGQHMVETDLARQLGVAGSRSARRCTAWRPRGGSTCGPARAPSCTCPPTRKWMSCSTCVRCRRPRRPGSRPGPRARSRWPGSGRSAPRARRRPMATTSASRWRRTTRSRRDCAGRGQFGARRASGIVGRRVRWYYRMVAPERGHGSWAEHAELIDAIEASDPERAQLLARKHTEQTRDACHRSLSTGAPPPARFRAA